VAARIAVRQYQPQDHEAVLKLHFEALKPTGALLPGGLWNDDDLNDIRKTLIQKYGVWCFPDWK